ncbi:hypothetical protein BDQ17DRAFT_1431136 [Cyathus striatus]|nr:hypothetical protein BDQ17DRAFT_1431136 [Cyathus striatus]
MFDALPTASSPSPLLAPESPPSLVNVSTDLSPHLIMIRPYYLREIPHIPRPQYPHLTRTGQGKGYLCTVSDDCAGDLLGVYCCSVLLSPREKRQDSGRQESPTSPRNVQGKGRLCGHLLFKFLSGVFAGHVLRGPGRWWSVRLRHGEEAGGGVALSGARRVGAAARDLYMVGL